MDRRLITEEPIGHPIRRAMVRRDAKPSRSDDQDLKLFVLSFTAFFVCFYTMIM